MTPASALRPRQRARLDRTVDFDDNLSLFLRMSRVDVPPTYATTNHDVIRRWARERRARPATLARADLGVWSCVLDLAFTGDREKDLRPIRWDAWLNAFDAWRLAFLYRTHRRDGVPSMYFRLADVATTARS